MANRPIYVKWVDSAVHEDGRWITPDSLPSDETFCETVGWLVKENDHSLYIAGHVHPDEVGSVMQIPKVAVKETRYLGQTQEAFLGTGWEDAA